MRCSSPQVRRAAGQVPHQRGALSRAGEPGECCQARAPASLFKLFIDVGAVTAANETAYAFGVNTGIPYIDVAHLSVFPHALAIGSHATQYRLSVHIAGEAHRSSRNNDACGKTLDIPLQRTWERLVKVVHIENLVPFRCGVDAKVAEVGIATHLHLQARDRSCSEVLRHDDCRSAQKAER